jgi:hypothetical protein
VLDKFTLGNLTANCTFIAVNQTANFPYSKLGADGVLGLGYYGMMNRGYQPIVNTLYLNRVISQPVFSLYFRDDFYLGRDLSNLMIGGNNMGVYANTTLVPTIYVNNVDLRLGKWLFEFDHIDMEDATVSAGGIIVLDSGDDHILVPSGDYPNVQAQLVALNFTLNSKNHYVKSNCNITTLPYFFLGVNFGYDYLQIPGYRWADEDDDQCTARILQSNDSNWYVGSLLFHTYYTTFNVQNSTMQFTPAAWYPRFVKKSSSSSDDLGGGAIAGIVIGCIVFVVAVAGIVFYSIRRKQRISQSLTSSGKPLQEVSLHA